MHGCVKRGSATNKIVRGSDRKLVCDVALDLASPVHARSTRGGNITAVERLSSNAHQSPSLLPPHLSGHANIPVMNRWRCQMATTRGMLNGGEYRSI